jgi:hypothetical protein
LRGRGHGVAAIDLSAGHPDWSPADYARHAAGQATTTGDRPVVVGHSGAGVLLPAIATGIGAGAAVWLAAYTPDLGGGRSMLDDIKAPLPDTISRAAIVPAGDRTLRSEWLREAARQRLGVEPVPIEAGHCPHVSQPQALARILAAVPGTGAAALQVERAAGLGVRAAGTGARSVGGLGQGSALRVLAHGHRRVPVRGDAPPAAGMGAALDPAAPSLNAWLRRVRTAVRQQRRGHQHDQRDDAHHNDDPYVCRRHDYPFFGQLPGLRLPATLRLTMRSGDVPGRADSRGRGTCEPARLGQR